MRKLTLLILLFFIFWANAQESRDSMRSRAKAVIYEQPDVTISLARKLLKDEKNPDEAAHLYMLISNAYIAKRNTDSSLYYILQAADLIKPGMLPTTKIKILHSIAVQYQQMDLYDKALATLDEAYAENKKITEDSGEHAFNDGFIHAVQGMIYRSQNNPELALEKFKLSAINFEKVITDKRVPFNLSIVYYNIGNSYLDLGKYTEADTQFITAHTYAEQVNAPSLSAYALKGRGETRFLQQQYQEALAPLTEAAQLAAPVGDLALDESIYRLLADTQLALKNFEEYRKYEQRHDQAEQQILENELKSLQHYLRVQDTGQKEQITAHLEKYDYILWVSSVLLVSLTALFLWRWCGLHRKNNRLRKITDWYSRRIFNP